MAKIASFKGMELEEVIEPKVFDEPHEMYVWNSSYIAPTRKSVCAIIPYRRAGSVITTTGAYEHCAEIPEKPTPRMATNRELAKWLAQGNGEYCFGTSSEKRFSSSFGYGCIEQDSEVSNLISVRKWDDTEWHEPTADYMGLEG